MNSTTHSFVSALQMFHGTPQTFLCCSGKHTFLAASFCHLFKTGVSDVVHISECLSNDPQSDQTRLSEIRSIDKALQLRDG